MASSERDVRRAVDEALDRAWAHERRRALQRWRLSTAARVAFGLLVLLVLDLVMRLMFDMTLPWAFFGIMGTLMATLAFSQTEGREHLR